MLQNWFYAILGTFYTLLNNTDLYLSYVFLGHNDSVEWGLTVFSMLVGSKKVLDCQASGCNMIIPCNKYYVPY